MARSLGKAYIARDHGLEYICPEKLPEVGCYLPGQIRPVVKHGKENPFDPQGMSEGFADAVDSIHEFGDAFQCKKLALNRHQHRIGRHQGVQSEKVQGWRAIDQDEVVSVPDAFQMVTENQFPVVHVDQLKIHADQILVGRKNIKALHAGVADGVFNFLSIDKNVVNGSQTRSLLDSEAAGRISLGIGVDQEDFYIADSEGGSKIDGGGSLTYTAFLVGYCNDSAHGLFGFGAKRTREPAFSQKLTLAQLMDVSRETSILECFT